jgi:hypothetical protein
MARRLAKKGIQVWLDKWNLIPGNPWQPDNRADRYLSDSVLVATQNQGAAASKQVSRLFVQALKTGILTCPSFANIPRLALQPHPTSKAPRSLLLRLYYRDRTLSVLEGTYQLPQQKLLLCYIFLRRPRCAANPAG